MNPNIDFSNYSQIKTENDSKFRKITRHKFTISYILFSIIIIILIIIISNKNKKISNKEEELSKIDKSLNEVNYDINNIQQKINKLEESKKNLINNLTFTDNQISNLKSEHDYLQKTNFQLLYNKNDLQAQKDYINNKIEYIKKFSKEENLEFEINIKNFLYKAMLQRLNNLSLNNSNIITNLDQFQTLTNTEIKNKCYDSGIYEFNINKFHENCDGYPLLILIKMHNGEKIGAFTSITNEGIKNVTDEKSLLINFDKNEYFTLDKENKECFVYSHFDKFPKFGNDLTIYQNGKGIYLGNKCYKLNGENNKILIEEKDFEIDYMEVYKVKL